MHGQFHLRADKLAVLLSHPEQLELTAKVITPELEECPRPCAQDPDSACCCWEAPSEGTA